MKVYFKSKLSFITVNVGYKIVSEDDNNYYIIDNDGDQIAIGKTLTFIEVK